MQIALDIPYSKVDGSLNLAELNGYLQKGWTVSTTDSNASGSNILVIIEEPAPRAEGEPL